MWATVVRFIGVKTKACTQVPGSHSWSGGPVPSPCRTPSSVPQTTPAPVCPGGPRPRGAELGLVSHPHLYIHCQDMMAPRPGLALCLGLHGCYAKSTQRNHLLASASFDHISLGLGERRFSFKLTNLFPNSLWACAAPSPIQSLSWSSEVPCPIGRFPGYPRLPSSPLCGHFGCCCASLSWRISPWLALPHLVVCEDGLAVPLGLSLVLSSSRILSICAAMGLSPGESGSCSSDLIRLNVWCHFAPFIAN